MPYIVKAHNYKDRKKIFEGPLDLLLELIEKEKLDVTEVSLARVADQFLKYLENSENVSPEYLADFLLVAGKLILIKSKAILPMLELEKEEYWKLVFEQAERLIFVPSTHVGPYLGKFKFGNTLWMLFGARIPEGVQVHAPDLSRAEILVRISALADDTRLRILKLVSEGGELCSHDIMIRLRLSQSAVSRHLKHLSATGYLSERRCNGAKCYALNPKRVEDTLCAISVFLLGK